MHERIDLICMQIEDVLRAEEKIFEQIVKMDTISINEPSAVLLKKLKAKGFASVKELALSRILNLEKEERLADLSTLSTRKKNILSDLEVNIMGEVQDKGGNLWGLFSGITKYTTHQLKGDSSENKLFGVYGRREREVFTELGELVS
jgi:tRNA U34 2-thiouridine synthase MnmA/TrmU